MFIACIKTPAKMLMDNSISIIFNVSFRDEFFFTRTRQPGHFRLSFFCMISKPSIPPLTPFPLPSCSHHSINAEHAEKKTNYPVPVSGEM